MKHLEKYISILSIVSWEFLVSQCFPARSSNKILDLAWLRCTWFCTRVHFSRSLTVQLRCWKWNKLRLDKFQHCAYLEAWFVSTLNFALSNTNLICCAHASKPYRILKMYALALVSSRFGIHHELQPRSQNHWNQHESNGLVELLVLRWDTLDSTRKSSNLTGIRSLLEITVVSWVVALKAILLVVSSWVWFWYGLAPSDLNGFSH